MLQVGRGLWLVVLTGLPACSADSKPVGATREAGTNTGGASAHPGGAAGVSGASTAAGGLSNASGGLTSAAGGVGASQATGGTSGAGGSAATGGKANTGGGSAAQAPAACVKYCDCMAAHCADKVVPGGCLASCASQKNWDLSCRQNMCNLVPDQPNNDHCTHALGVVQCLDK
jgi:hypothetical protein